MYRREQDAVEVDDPALAEELEAAGRAGLVGHDEERVPVLLEPLGDVDLLREEIEVVARKEAGPEDGLEGLVALQRVLCQNRVPHVSRRQVLLVVLTAAESPLP